MPARYPPLYLVEIGRSHSLLKAGKGTKLSDVS